MSSRRPWPPSWIRRSPSHVFPPGTAEAREWLDPAKHPNHTDMEMSADKARALVSGFYDRGAERVYVLSPTPLINTVLTAQIALKLATDPAQRKTCLEWEVSYLEGGGPSQDFGQSSLVITTD